MGSGNLVWFKDLCLVLEPDWESIRIMKKDVVGPTTPQSSSSLSDFRYEIGCSEMLSYPSLIGR